MADSFEMVDSSNIEKLALNIEGVLNTWTKRKEKAEESGETAHAVICGYFIDFASDLFLAVEDMMKP